MASRSFPGVINRTPQPFHVLLRAQSPGSVLDRMKGLCPAMDLRHEKKRLLMEAHDGP